ncbi:uncharacterized protein EHS24_004547 [Apiotrichum porosum]|uniref:Major facilitator superfamily (MFS) profile domain-containing protein n=1 Tax=Apiotrichum porosum TaxID=105984 RepID=A0A427Y5E8_9TREE|nr:uncharacterized protein EHS24_004547 [Apiotrichum porosum]RSH86305.1 hypothetical protein EHS24_004547 [Apiotrichum porosum]
MPASVEHSDTDDSASVTSQPKKGWSLSAERKLVLKLDASLLIFSVLGLICRYIDQTNMSTAFVSGMKEDLGMYGLQYNYANTCWVVGYVIGQIPGNILLNRFSPHYVVFILEFGWSIMTLCTTWVTTYQQIYVIRFFVGLFESAYYPGLHFLIGSWYSKEELGKRASLFQAACAIGTLLSQVLQGGVHTTLNGVAGRPGWRWIFIIDAVISFPVAIGAFLMLPDLPEKIRPNWIFNQDDIDLARARLAAEGRKGTSKDGFSRKAFTEIFSTWHIWVFTICYSLYIFMQKFDVTGVHRSADQLIASSFFLGWVDDTFLKQRRWPLIVATSAIHIIALYYLTGMIEVGAGLTYAWAASVISTSSEKRAIVTGTYNSVAFSFNAWLPLIFFKQTDQPAVFKGNVAVSVASGLLIVFIFLILYLSKRDERRARLAQGDESVSTTAVQYYPQATKADSFEVETGKL